MELVDARNSASSIGGRACPLLLSLSIGLGNSCTDPPRRKMYSLVHSIMRSMSGKCLGKSADMDGMETASPNSEIYWEMELSTCSKKGVANAAEEEGEEDAMANGVGMG